MLCRRVRRAVCSEGGWVSHLARLAAVGLALALGALQQRRRERLAARRVAARERGGAGRLLGHRSPGRLLAVSPLSLTPLITTLPIRRCNRQFLSFPSHLKLCREYSEKKGMTKSKIR